MQNIIKKRSLKALFESPLKLRENRRLLMEGPGSGVSFDFSEVFIGEVSIKNGEIEAPLLGEVTLESAYDVSVVKSGNDPILGKIVISDFALEKFLRENLEEFDLMNSYGSTDMYTLEFGSDIISALDLDLNSATLIEANFIGIEDKIMYGRGSVRAGAPSSVEIEAYVELIFEFDKVEHVEYYDEYNDDEKEIIGSELPYYLWSRYETPIMATIELHPIFESAYSDLDDPDRYNYEDEDGNIVDGSEFIDKEDITFYT